MKALILAAGRGKRLGQLTEEKNKCMIEINGKPLIAYSLDSASIIEEISEIIIIVGYQKDEIMERFGNQYQGKPLKYVVQSEQKGLVDAIACAKEAVNKDDFMLMLGDELMINPKHKEMIKFFKEHNLSVLCGILEVQDKNLIKKTYATVQGENGNIVRLIEKPENPTGNIMGTGNCIFKNEIFSFVPCTPINQKRKEKELPDLIQCAIDDGKIVKPFNICNRYFNFNIREEINEAESFFAHFSEGEKGILI